jgi:hypothetical protein
MDFRPRHALTLPPSACVRGLTFWRKVIERSDAPSRRRTMQALDLRESGHPSLASSRRGRETLAR